MQSLVESTPRPIIEIPETYFPEVINDSLNLRFKAVNFAWKTIIINQHRVVLNEIIGLGSQGKVYAGISNLYGDVAVKEIPRIFVPIIHYKAESLGIGPKLYDVYYDNTYTYIIMERLDRTITLRDIYSYSYEICEMVTILIENGIFHNDLRDTNIMFSSSEQSSDGRDHRFSRCGSNRMTGEQDRLYIVDYDSAAMAFSDDDDDLIRFLNIEEYNTYLKKNYYIYISGKKYMLNFSSHPALIDRLHKAIDKFVF